MQNIKNRVTFFLSAILYFVFNLRLGSDVQTSLNSTIWQILQTAPYVAGVSYLIIAVLQYMADGEKLPWDRRFRIFFALGIITGLIMAIYEYAKVDIG